METVTVKSTSVKRGTNEKGDWCNTQITPTEGRKWTGFIDSLASLKEGDVINITEYEEGTGNKLNKILKYEKVSSAAAAPSANGKPEMTPELWAEKDRLERWSTECNTCFMGIMELAGSEQFSKLKNGSDETEVKLTNVLHDALDWASAHFEPITQREPAKKPGEKAPASKKTEEPEKSIVDLDWLKEKLTSLQSKGLPDWEESAVLAFIKKTYQVEGDTVFSAAAKLGEGKAAHFVKRIEDAIDWNKL